MATETLAPDALLASAGFSSCVLGDLTSDPDAGDANWCVASSNNVNTATRTSFATPSANPNTGADLQEFRAEVRRTAGSGTADPTVRIELWENGALIRAGGETTITSDASQVIAFTWDAAELATADGSLVECKVVGTKSGGSPAKRSAVDVGGIEWNAEVAGAGETIEVLKTAFGFTPQPFNVNATTDIEPAAAALAVTPQPFNVNAATDIVPAVAGLAFVGQAVTESVGATVEVLKAAFGFVGQALGLNAATNIAPANAGFAFAAQAFNVNAATKIAPGASGFGFAGRAFVVSIDIVSEIAKAAFAVAGQAVGTNAATRIMPVPAAFAFAGQALVAAVAGGVAAAFGNVTRNVARRVARNVTRDHADQMGM